MTKNNKSQGAALQLPPKYEEFLKYADGLKAVAKVVKFASFFGVGGKKSMHFVHQIEEMYRQSNELFILLQKFNRLFQPLGWIMSESSNIESAKIAVALFEAGKSDEAESILVSDYTGEKLDFVCMRFNGISAFRKREHLIKEAVNLCHEERFTAAIPMMFLIVDGVGQDSFGKSIFSEGVDLTELNAIAGHETALPALTALFGKRRQAFNEEQLTLPYRNGIMHGRDINYGNNLVAAKLWAYLSCVADLIREKREAQGKEPQPELTLWETLERHKEIKKKSEMISAWRARPILEPNWALSSELPNNFEKETPEAALVEFLLAWRNQNYGIMGKRTVYFDNRPIKKRAGQIRENIKEFKLMDAEIVKIKDETTAITEIECRLSVMTVGGAKVEPFTFRLIYGCEHSNGMPREEKGGLWRIIPFYQGWVYSLLSEEKSKTY